MSIGSVEVGIVPISVVVAAGILAAIIDVRVFKVHNLLTIPLAVTGIVFHSMNGGIGGLGFSVLGLLVGFASLIIFYALGGIGAGDVKLMAGIGAWLGAGLTLNVFLIAGIAAGLYSLVLILSSGGIQHVMTNLAILAYRVRSLAVHFSQDERVETVVADHQNRRRRLVPFAAMVLMGIIGVVIASNSSLGFPISLR